MKELDGCFSEEKHDGWSNKYMHIVKNDTSKDYVKIWKINGDKIDKIGNSKGEYEDDSFMKVVVNSDDDLPVDKVMNFDTVTLTIPHVFNKRGNRYFPQFFLADCFYEDM